MTIDERTMGSWSLPGGHLRAMGAAREAGAPIIAANAPRRYVRHLREAGPEGFERLTPEQRRLVEDPGELTGGRYRDAFMGLMEGMAGHGAAERVDARAFYFAQNIWDATMADSVIDALDRGHRPVILIVGQFHSDDNGGVLQRIAEARPAASIYTVSYQPVFSPTLRQEDRTRAGAVVYTAPPSGDGDALME